MYIELAAGLLRCGKSCRLRWMNYLRPDIKRGNITSDEDDLIIRLHSLLGNRWSLIAGRLPGRTDNEIKNYWNTHLSKRLRCQGTDPNTHKKLPENNKLQSINKEKSKVKATRSKVHLPKPIRLPPSFSNSSLPTTKHSASRHGRESSGLVTDFAVDAIPSYNLNRPSNGYHVQCHDHLYRFHGLNVDSSDFECQSDQLLTADHISLEKLYKEYLQLLKTDNDQFKID